MENEKNSSLVAYKKLSPNHSGQRNHSIDRISPHCVVGQCTAEGLGDWFARSSTQASSNYGIDKNGRVGLYVEEKNRSWCTSSSANDNRAVTIECASGTSEPYVMNDAVYATLIKLCADICKRNGKKKLLWLGSKEKALAYTPASDEMVITVHRWFASKSCPGNWLYSRLGDLAEKVNGLLAGGDVDVTPANPTTAPRTTNTEGKAVTISTYTLQKGSTGSRVRKLQILLNGLGHNCGEVDGDFGTKTLAAVKAFQTAQKITADGIVGAVTWTKLIN